MRDARAADTATPFKGVFSVLPTPFVADGAVNFADLRRIVGFLIGAGVDGLTALGVMSETARLTEHEALEILRCVMEEAAGKVPVVVGTTTDGEYTGIEAARQARSFGAAAVMVATPRMRQNSDAVLRHFSALAEAVDIPIVLQDYPAASGVSLEPWLIARMVREIPAIAAIKLEDPPTAPKIAALRAEPHDVGIPIFGGLGGLFLFEELLAGSTGAMTGFAFPEILVQVVRAFHDGRVDEAADIFYRNTPVLRLEAQEGVGPAIRKEFLRRRGVISGAGLRAPAPRLDAATLKAIGHVLAWAGLAR